MRHLQSKDFVKLAIKSNPIHRLDFLPILQRHNKIEPLLDSNAANAKNGSHVDNADPANLDVIACQFGCHCH